MVIEKKKSMLIFLIQRLNIKILKYLYNMKEVLYMKKLKIINFNYFLYLI